MLIDCKNKVGNLGTIIVCYNKDVGKNIDGRMVVMDSHTEIQLRKKFKGPALAEILMHEFAHYINYVCGLGNNDKFDETVAEKMGLLYLKTLDEESAKVVNSLKYKKQNKVRKINIKINK